MNNACKRKAKVKLSLKKLGQSTAKCSNFVNTDVNKIRKNIYASRKTLLPSMPTNVDKARLTIHNLISGAKWKFEK